MTPDDLHRHQSGRRPGAPPRQLRDLRRPEHGTPVPAEDEAEPPQPRHKRIGMIALRYVLPGVVVLAGVIAMAFGTDTSLEGGAGLVSAGLAIWFVNWLFRIGAVGDEERDAEEQAREYFDRHGHWPDER
jgi:hypothetical protein